MNTKTDQEKIGSLIRDLRTSKGFTQTQFAQSLSTSQSAIARMEKGNQNFSIKELAKISDALEHPLISMSHNQVDDFRVEGGRRLSGSLTTNFSKNGALPLICASLINKGKTILHGIPKIQEIFRMIELLESLNVLIKWTGETTLEIQRPENLDFEGMDKSAARRMRSSIMLIGALSGQKSAFALPHAGGCNMGKRTIAAHAYGLESLGIGLNITDLAYEIDPSEAKATEMTMYEASDTGTENVLMAAAQIPGITTIHFAQENYMVQDLIGFLKVMGAEIERKSITTITVKGVSDCNQTLEYWNSEDPIESMAFISAAITTKSKLTIKRCPIDFLRLEVQKLAYMGQKFEYSQFYVSRNGFTNLVDITVIPSNLVSLSDKIHAQPYPGINTDNLPFFVPIATQTEGRTLIHDWMWENRAIYFTELNKLRASVELVDPHRVFVNGVTKLKASQIVCPPALRPSMILLIGMMAAEGTSTLRNVYSIKRGYQDLVTRLNKVGASIESLSSIS